MTRARRIVLASVLAAAAGAAWAQAPGPAAAPDCDRCGKIESIRPMTAKDTWTPLGTVATAPSGSITTTPGAAPAGVAVYQIGPGFSKQGTVLLGAAGGAAYGTRPSELNRPRWEIVVRMDSGGTRSVVQNYEPMVHEGDRVRVMGTQLELVPVNAVAAAAPDAAVASARLTVSDAADGSLILALAGRLDAYSIAGVWTQARAALAAAADRRIVVDASAVDYCDGGGVAMLVDLLRQPRAAGAAVSVRGLRPAFQTLLDQFDLSALAAPAALPQARVNAIEDIGRATATLWRDMRMQIEFIGETASALGHAATHPQQVRWKDVWYTCEQVGANALPIVALISFLFGVILAFEAAVPMRQFGAEIFVADLIGLSILRELGPLMTAILLAGRSGAAFAAEIGTMKVNEELNALTTMGLDPVRFLVVTRILAALLMVPLLSLFADLIGVLAGGLTMLSFNIPFVTYIKEIASIVDLKDVLVGLVKTPVFAILIAGIGCLRGLQTQTGASAVGISATRAVVSGIVLLVAVDGIFAVIYYILDL